MEFQSSGSKQSCPFQHRECRRTFLEHTTRQDRTRIQYSLLYGKSTPYLFRLLLLEEVVKIDEDDLEDELGDEMGDVPHSDLRSPDDMGKSAHVSGLEFT